MSTRTKHIVMKEKSKGLEFCNNKQQSNILHELNLSRKVEHLCDVVLVVEEKRYPAHKAILMVASDYFKAMFSLRMRESSAPEITLTGLVGSVIEQLLNYIYTGTLCVNKNDVQDLFIASDMLQMDDVKEMCITYMTKHITVTNCVDLFQFGESFHSQAIIDKSLQYIRQLYPVVSTTTAFRELSYQAVCTIIEDDHLSLEPEGEACVLNSILSWLEEDSDARFHHASSLFSHIRWKSLSGQSVDKALQHSVVSGNSELKDVIWKAKESSTLGPRHLKLVVAGGYLQSRTGPDCPRLCSVETLDLKTLEWNRLANLPLESTPPSFTHILMVCGQLIALCLTYSNKESKSHYCLQKIYKYDGVLEGWQSLDENLETEQLMNTLWDCTKCNGAVVSYHGTIYMVSYKGAYLVYLQCECDDVVVGQIRRLPSIPGYLETGRCRQYMSLVVCKGHLYSVGGSDVLSKSEIYPVTDVYRLEDDENTWQRKADLLTARSSLAAAALGDQIYVTGGVNNFRLCSVERYCPDTDMWTKLRDMHKPRSYHASIAAQGRIYVLGGQTYHKNEGRKVLNVCDVYYPEKNCWFSVMKAMNHARCLAAATVM